MRDQFHGELRVMSDSMVEMTRLLADAIATATRAILEADLGLAERVIAADARIDALQLAVEDRAMVLLARQQPVATDLRVIVTSLRISADLERMGDLARHVAKVARLRYPRAAVPEEVRDTVARMGETAERIVRRTGDIIGSRDVAAARELDRDDDVMDELHRLLFTLLLDPAWPHGVEAAVDITLCGRFYERFADHAVSVARRVVFLVTGVRGPLEPDLEPPYGLPR